MSTTIDQTTEERLRAIADAGHPEAWMPDAPGQELTGIVVDYTQAYTARGELANVMVIESLKTPGKRMSVWLLHTTLRNEILKQQPKIGETIFLRYMGLQTPKAGGEQYHGWNVVVDRNAETARYPWTLPADTPTATGAQTGFPNVDTGTGEVHSGLPTGGEGTTPATPADDDIPF